MVEQAVALVVQAEELRSEVHIQAAQEQHVVAGEHTQVVHERQAVAEEPRPDRLHQIHQQIEHAEIAPAGIEAVAFGEIPLAIAAVQALV